MKYDKLVMHIPHFSTDGINDSGWPKSDSFQSEVNKWTDWATDKIFDLEVLNTEYPRIIETIKFPLSRFVLDVERLPNDPLEAIGQGKIYRRFGVHERVVSLEEERQLQEIYNSHQRRIVSSLTPGSLLIDCHSFPSVLSDVDVCVGYNEDWSKPSKETIDLIVDKFTNHGYKVGINNPYSNSIAPICDFSYHSVMIELNKRTYWDEDKLEMNKGAIKIHSLLMDLCVKLLGCPC